MKAIETFQESKYVNGLQKGPQTRSQIEKCFFFTKNRLRNY